jgi:hypothetical protein
MDLKTLAPELNNQQIKAVYRLVYEDMVGSVPEDAHERFVTPEYNFKQRGYNQALDQTRTALDTKLQEVLEEL